MESTCLVHRTQAEKLENIAYCGLVLNGALALIIYPAPSLFNGRPSSPRSSLSFALQGRLMDGRESPPQDPLGSFLLVFSLSIHLCIFTLLGAQYHE